MKTSLFSLVLVITGLFTQNVFAQATQRVRPNFQHGDIVVSTTGRMDGELGIADQASSDQIIGVYNASTEFSNVPNIYLSGIAEVKFDHSNGEVVRGDLITSSANTGKGMKVTQSGMTIGVALEASTPTSDLLKILVQPSWVTLTVQN